MSGLVDRANHFPLHLPVMGKTPAGCVDRKIEEVRKSNEKAAWRSICLFRLPLAVELLFQHVDP